jgi:hypothetical protein
VALRVGFPLAAIRRAMNRIGKVCGVLHNSVRLLSLSRAKNTRIELSHPATYLARRRFGAPGSFLMLESIQAHHRPTYGRLPSACTAVTTARPSGSPCRASCSSQRLWRAAKFLRATTAYSCINPWSGSYSSYDPSAAGCSTCSWGIDDMPLPCPARNEAIKGTVHFVVYRLHIRPYAALQPGACRRRSRP